MITIISGTNRPDSKSLKLAQLYAGLLAQSEEVKILSLANAMIWERNAEMIAVEEEYLVPAEKFVFVMPEYNASFPGAVKVLLDNSDIKKCWWYKKAMLVGLSEGRAGNIRGVEHMTSILHYLKVHVLYNKVLISRMSEEMDDAGKLLKKETADMIKLQTEEFIKF